MYFQLKEQIAFSVINNTKKCIIYKYILIFLNEHQILLTTVYIPNQATWEIINLGNHRKCKAINASLGMARNYKQNAKSITTIIL